MVSKRTPQISCLRLVEQYPTCLARVGASGSSRESALNIPHAYCDSTLLPNLEVHERKSGPMFCIGKSYAYVYRGCLYVSRFPTGDTRPSCGYECANLILRFAHIQLEPGSYINHVLR